MIRTLMQHTATCFSRFKRSGRRVSTSDLEHWEYMAKRYGRRSVLNIEHKEDEYELVTVDQKSKLFPLLQSQLRGTERTVLDFGCGPGRFTPDLAKIVQGCCIGVDPVEYFLDIAPRSEYAEYLLLHNEVIPLLDASMDVVWICLVLGGITRRETLENAVREIDRILKEDGLVFLVENTTERPDLKHWKYRPFAYYQELFDFAPLKYLSDYFDLGERISVMAGRKVPLKVERPRPRLKRTGFSRSRRS